MISVDSWRRFRQLEACEELLDEATALLHESWPLLEPQDEAIYGMALAMQSFFLSCNAQPNTVQDLEHPFCLYGAVSALWVTARHGALGGLQHAKFLLGDVFRLALDFMEGSAWPISSLHILANEATTAFRLPTELPSRLEAVGSEKGKRSKRVSVWELGVHASLSAEPLHMWARLLDRQLLHRNLIRDQYPEWLPDRCATLYRHKNLRCDLVEDEVSELFRRRIPQSARSKEPIEDLQGLAREFRAAVRGRLKGVDLFLCTIATCRQEFLTRHVPEAYLCLVFEPLELPIVGYFGHPLLFMVPLASPEPREAFWASFTSMARSRGVAFAVSDPFLQMQFEYQVGSLGRLKAIRTHALYTNVVHVAGGEEVLVLDRPHESVLMCLLQRAMGPTEVWRTQEGRLRAAESPEYPYRFITSSLELRFLFKVSSGSLTDKTFKSFARFRAVVLWPYDMDLITFYEFYSMNMPLFMPNHPSKYLFHQERMRM